MAQLLSNLPIGAKVKIGKYSVNGEVAQDIIWLIVAKNHSGYPSDSITLLTEKIIDLRCFDAKEPNNPATNRPTYGNNRYSQSNIDQWLNKDAYDWYIASHIYDQSPNNVNVAGETYYAMRPGFLHEFSPGEKNIILNTTVRVIKPVADGGEYEDISRKVFLPSCTEVGLANEANVPEGSLWSYFSTQSRRAYLTNQAFERTLSTDKPSAVTNTWTWLLRTPGQNAIDVQTVYIDDSRLIARAYEGSKGVRPAINVLSTALLSDSIDGDGCYTIIGNSAPPQPTSLNVPVIYGGKSNVISWDSVTDPDADIITYWLECSLDGGDYVEMYSGTSTTYAHLVPFGTTSVTYRVKATDPLGESSVYTTSATITVINNNAPVISGSDTNLGVKNTGFRGTYTITDANSDTVTVTEAIDGVRIRSLVATLGEEITYGVTENTWLSLPNGSHTLTISATDGIDTTVRTYAFTKLVDTLKIQNATPWVSSTMPSRIMLVITRNIPSAATFKVEVCNNGYDASPTWEDATDAVKSGLVHVFSNTVKAEDSWGVAVRVTVARNGATGACYVSAIGGNFE